MNIFHFDFESKKQTQSPMAKSSPVFLAPGAPFVLRLSIIFILLLFSEI